MESPGAAAEARSTSSPGLRPVCAASDAARLHAAPSADRAADPSQGIRFPTARAQP